jgi:DNA polymerase III subunit epsilon
MTWHDGPLLVLDTETTGQDPETARIVTAYTATVPAGDQDARTWIINPGIEIPAEATAVHGITTAHAQTYGADPATATRQIYDTIQAAWAAQVPVVAYNAVYDLTVLDRDLRRHGHDGITEVGPVIDPLVLDRGLDPYRRGRRTLTAACDHYQVALDGAHEASADALAAGRVAWRIGQRYPAVAGMSLTELQDTQARMHLAWATHFQEYLRSKGSPDVIDPSWPIRASTAGAPK